MVYFYIVLIVTVIILLIILAYKSHEKFDYNYDPKCLNTCRTQNTNSDNQCLNDCQMPCNNNCWEKCFKKAQFYDDYLRCGVKCPRVYFSS